MTKILLVGEFESLNGGERSTLVVVKELRNRYRFEAAVPTTGAFAESLRALNIPVHDFQCYNREGKRSSLNELRNQIAQVIDRVEPDLVHAISLSTSRILGPVCAECDVKSIGHLRDIIRVSQQVMHDLNRNSMLVAVSRATLEWHVSNGLDEQISRVVHNGIDLEQFTPRETRHEIHDELGLDHEAALLVSIGQIGMRKGLDVLLDAFEIACQQETRAHLVIVGQRFSEKEEAVEHEQLLRNRSGLGGLKGRVHWLGYRYDVHRILNDATLVVHSARQEPLGRVLLEAAASGVPMIATDVGGTREIFPDNSGAIIVEKDRGDQIAAAIVRVLTNPELQRSMGRMARERVVSCFDARQSAMRMNEVYQEGLDR